MTSKLTREERVQALYDLKVGQVLSLADIENVKMLSRMALAAMDSEPVAFIDKQWTLVYYVPPMNMGLQIGDKLYRHAQPAPVVHDRSIFEKWWESQNGAPFDGWDSLRTNDGYCDDGIDGQFEAWSAAMLAATPQEVK